jgi:hypothetical protein
VKRSNPIYEPNSPKTSCFLIEDTVRISGYFEAHSQIREALNALKMPKLANDMCALHNKDEPKMLQEGACEARKPNI